MSIYPRSGQDMLRVAFPHKTDGVGGHVVTATSALGGAAYGRLLLPALSLVMDAGGWAAALPSAEDARGALGVASEAVLAAAATATLALDDLSVAARTLKPVRAALELAECDDWLLATARQEAAALVGVRRWAA